MCESHMALMAAVAAKQELFACTPVLQ